MTAEHEIGRVVAVDTAQVTVELSRELKALTRSTYEGTIEVGRINSYIIIPVGSRRIVAMVTRVVMTEESEVEYNRTMISLPSTRRLMKATMIGTTDEGRFRQGINLFPVLDSKVFLTTRKDLDAIFGKNYQTDTDPEEAGYCISIGKSVIFPDYDIYINPDSFFGKHAAILGSTGSGKSCSIATILQSILSRADIRQTRIVILDTNGEYQAAFQRRLQDGSYSSTIPNRRSLYIPTDPTEKDRLVIPYWFMNSGDFVRLFRAAPQTQRPVLLNALTLSRQQRLGPDWSHLRDDLIQECHRLSTLIETGEWKERNSIGVICDGVLAALDSDHNRNALNELIEQYPILANNSLRTAIQEVKRVTARRNATDYDPIGMSDKQRSESLISEILSTLSTTPAEALVSGGMSADWPSYFTKSDFRYRHLETAMSRDQSNSSRTRENCSTMLTRILRLLEDSRFEFLFGPSAEELPEVRHALATFLRDILGLSRNTQAELSNAATLRAGPLPYYDR